MLAMTTGPVEVVDYEEMGANRPEGAFRYGDGTPVEAVKVRVEGEDSLRTIKLDKSVNGSRAKVGEVVSLQLVSNIVADAKIGRDGRPFPITKEKVAVLGFVPAPAK